MHYCLILGRGGIYSSNEPGLVHLMVMGMVIFFPTFRSFFFLGASGLSFLLSHFTFFRLFILREL